MNETLFTKLWAAVVKVAMKNGIDPARITDTALSRAIEESYRTGPKNHGAGLLTLRVPEIIRSWATTEVLNDGK